MSGDLWQVAVNAPIHDLLTYICPTEIDLKEGQSIKVPLGKRVVDAVAVQRIISEKKTAYKLKEIIELHPERSILPPEYLSWMKWLAQYYCHPIGAVSQMFFPPLKKKGRAKKTISFIPPEEGQNLPPEERTLTDEQKSVIASISENSGFSAHLLFGVTGSGKTEVYLQLLEKVLSRGQQGIVLVPEISLTPQLINRFSERFGPKIAAIHSHLTEREKTNQWWSMLDGKKQILIGARSALFCPLKNVGLIIIDEEHESSFKQDEKLKYHARDAAVALAHKLNCPIVLGSATPSLETWQNIINKKYQLHTMKHRVFKQTMPKVTIVDLTKINKEEKTNLPFWLTQTLYDGLKNIYESGKQSALFLNRRGIAQTVNCQLCGETIDCPNCAITLTLHAKSHLVCHYCDYHENLAELCKKCGDGELSAFGLGTEQVENDIRLLFPEAKIARADRDQISSRQDLETFISSVEKKEVDFIVGTQMIAKGLDFPHLKLVGIVLADIGFNIPDFRSNERVFQLITQVSGRAGRHLQPGESSGEVIIQTFNPEHKSLQFAINNDFIGFTEYELAFRKSLSYPPIGRLASLRIQSNEYNKSSKGAEDIKNLCINLQKKFPNKYNSIQILGPSESPLVKLRNQYRFQIFLKSDQNQILSTFCSHLLQNASNIPKGVRILVDIDPLHLL